jgi:hypothetical protein
VRTGRIPKVTNESRLVDIGGFFGNLQGFGLFILTLENGSFIGLVVVG